MNRSTLLKLSAVIASAFFAFGANAQNVGIDDNTPEQKLDVNGAIKIGNTPTGVAGSIRWNGTNYQVWDPAIPGWRNFGEGPDADWMVVGNDMYSQVSGNVGIGTPTPISKLQVVGTARVSALNVNGAYSLPTVDGTSGYVLQTNGAGVVTWQPETGDISSVTPGLGLVGNTPITSGAVTLDVNVDGSTLEIFSDVLRVRQSGITANEIATDAVGSLEIATDAVGATEIATGAVTTDEILNGTILSEDIGVGQVTSSNIQNGTIVVADLATAGNNQFLTTNGSGVPQWQNQSSLFGAQAGDGLLYDGTNNELDVNPGDGIQIVSDQVTVNASALEGNGLSVVSNNFNVNVDNSTLEIASDIIRVKNDGIGSAQIQNNAVGSSEIADNAVGSSEILDGSVTTNEIADQTIAPIDIDPSGTVNQVLATTVANTTVAWVDPSSLTTQLIDGSLNGNNTWIRVATDLGANNDIIRMTTAGTERMRIDASGNVGIGTGTGAIGRKLMVEISDNSALNTPIPAVVKNAGAVDGAGVGFGFQVHNDASSAIKSAIYNERQGDFGHQGKLHILMNGQNSTASASLADSKLTVLANGNVGIGNTAPTYKLHVNGKVKSAGINETSDARLKKDIQPIENALSMVNDLAGVTYNWRTDEFPELQLETNLQYGLIAQEVEKVIPELVDTDSEGWKSIEYSHFVPVLIEALKEQQAIINDLKSELTSSNKALNELKAEVELIKTNTLGVGLND